ncbi:hypothetical protein DQ04_04761000, partial [Trypanosoma grayi]|uniref:hypothetical protein n=1 Tax=Trypanosoma grayi TaxID=71804 RepID=UPI0004F4329C
MVKFRYNGDFSVQLCGLEINLDTVGASAEEADENYALPFFCPFEMTLQGINLDGMVSIEVFHELEEDPQQGQDCAVAVHTAVAPRVGKSSSLRPPRSARSASARGRSGYGVLLGSGG